MLSVRCNNNNMFRFGLDNFASTNIVDEDNKFLFTMEVPGVTKEEINIDIDDDILTVHVTSKKDVKDDEYLHQEIRKDIDVKRSYQLKNIDPDTLTAKLNDGILTIEASKKEPINTKKNILIE